jgi:hypothetical protein
VPDFNKLPYSLRSQGDKTVRPSDTYIYPVPILNGKKMAAIAIRKPDSFLDKRVIKSIFFDIKRG